MPVYLVRVTRDFVEETVDLEIEADSWEAAKTKAIKEAKSDPGMYFGVDPDPEFYVSSMDDDEVGAVIED